MARARQRFVAAVLPGNGLDVLRRRSQRNARRGEFRKAALIQRQVVAHVGDAASWVCLGHFLRRAGKLEEAIGAFKQGWWLHRRADRDGRARTVARLLQALAPADQTIVRFLRHPVARA